MRARWLAWSWLRLRYAASAERCANPDPEIAAIPIGPKRLSRHRGPPPCREPEQQDGDAEHQVRQLGPRAGPGCAQDQDLAHDPAEQDRVGCDEGGDRPRRHERDDGRGRGAAADQDRKDRSWSEVADERCSVQEAGREAISLQPGDERDATADGRQGDEPVQSHQSDAPWGPGWPRPAPCRAERAGGAASSSSSQRRWSRPPAATRSSSTLPRTGRSIAFSRRSGWLPTSCSASPSRRSGQSPRREPAPCRHRGCARYHVLGADLSGDCRGSAHARVPQPPLHGPWPTRTSAPPSRRQPRASALRTSPGSQPRSWSIGTLTMPLVMLGGVFSRSSTHPGITTGVVGIVSESPRRVLGVGHIFYGLPLLVRFIAVSWARYRLAGREGGIGTTHTATGARQAVASAARCRTAQPWQFTCASGKQRGRSQLCVPGHAVVRWRASRTRGADST